MHMKRTSASSNLVILAFWFLVGMTAPAFAYLNDPQVHVASNYYNSVPPANGGTYKDAVFGTEIRRISDALSQRNADRGGNLTFIVDEYSTMTAFNSDNSLILLQHQSYFALYDGSGKYLRDLP